MEKQTIQTGKAPAAIGTYSQAVKVGDTVYISGQIALDAQTGEFVQGDFSEHVRQIFRNLQAIAHAAGGELADMVKLTVYLSDMQNFVFINEVMQEFFEPPYPARAAVAVKTLPKNAAVEIEALMVL